MLTEDEARKKWCPFVRIANGKGNAVAVNALMDSESQRCCIASECAAWRWGGALEYAVTKARQIPGTYVIDVPKPPGAGWEMRRPTIGPENEWVRESQTHGFCGLAGKP